MKVLTSLCWIFCILHWIYCGTIDSQSFPQPQSSSYNTGHRQQNEQSAHQNSFLGQDGQNTAAKSYDSQHYNQQQPYSSIQQIIGNQPSQSYSGDQSAPYSSVQQNQLIDPQQKPTGSNQGYANQQTQGYSNVSPTSGRELVQPYSGEQRSLSQHSQTYNVGQQPQPHISTSQRDQQQQQQVFSNVHNSFTSQQQPHSSPQQVQVQGNLQPGTTSYVSKENTNNRQSDQINQRFHYNILPKTTNSLDTSLANRQIQSHTGIQNAQNTPFGYGQNGYSSQTSLNTELSSINQYQQHKDNKAEKAGKKNEGVQEKRNFQHSAADVVDDIKSKDARKIPLVLITIQKNKNVLANEKAKANTKQIVDTGSEGYDSQTSYRNIPETPQNPSLQYSTNSNLPITGYQANDKFENQQVENKNIRFSSINEQLGHTSGQTSANQRQGSQQPAIQRNNIPAPQYNNPVFTRATEETGNWKPVQKHASQYQGSNVRSQNSAHLQSPINPNNNFGQSQTQNVPQNSGIKTVQTSRQNFVASGDSASNRELPQQFTSNNNYNLHEESNNNQNTNQGYLNQGNINDVPANAEQINSNQNSYVYSNAQATKDNSAQNVQQGTSVPLSHSQGNFRNEQYASNENTQQSNQGLRQVNQYNANSKNTQAFTNSNYNDQAQGLNNGIVRNSPQYVSSRAQLSSSNQPQISSQTTSNTGNLEHKTYNRNNFISQEQKFDGNYQVQNPVNVNVEEKKNVDISRIIQYAPAQLLPGNKVPEAQINTGGSTTTNVKNAQTSYLSVPQFALQNQRSQFRDAVKTDFSNAALRSQGQSYNYPSSDSSNYGSVSKQDYNSNNFRNFNTDVNQQANKNSNEFRNVPVNSQQINRPYVNQENVVSSGNTANQLSSNYGQDSKQESNKEAARKSNTNFEAGRYEGNLQPNVQRENVQNIDHLNVHNRPSTTSNIQQNTNYGSSFNNQQPNYGSGLRNPLNYGFDSSSRQNYGSTLNNQQNYGSGLNRQQNFGSDTNNQQSYGSNLNSQQNYGSSETRNLVVEAKQNEKISNDESIGISQQYSEDNRQSNDDRNSNNYLQNTDHAVDITYSSDSSSGTIVSEEADIEDHRDSPPEALLLVLVSAKRSTVDGHSSEEKVDLNEAYESSPEELVELLSEEANKQMIIESFHEATNGEYINEESDDKTAIENDEYDRIY